MNDPSQTTPNAVDSPIDAAGPVRAVDPSRRRLVRSGLAGSVLLGSLVSKPVLGAEYICTVSGHTSGNASAHLMNVDCATGFGEQHWRDAEWVVSGVMKGAMPKTTEVTTTDSTGSTVSSTICAVGESEELGTLFNGFAGLVDSFFYDPNAACSVGLKKKLKLGSGSETTWYEYQAASMLQVLNTTDTGDSGDGADFRLGRAVVVSILNAATVPGYPVSQARVIDMFNKVNGGGVYRVDGANLDLTRLGVIQYLEKLYTPSV